MFPFIKGSGRLVTDYSQARVTSASINQAKTNMDITLLIENPVPPFELSIIEELISAEFGIKTVTVIPTYKTQRESSPTAAPTQDSNNPSATSRSKAPTDSITAGAVIMGRALKKAPVPIGGVTIDDGRVTIRGDVFNVRSRHIEKGDSWLLNFDITDYTGSMNVVKFMREDKNENAEKIVNSIKSGMYLTVSGTLGYSRYDNELVLDPQNIFPCEKAKKHDNAEEKRVELHLHTKMSAMDALTDTEDVIKRAAEWGHPAIAITDHGVVHSFPIAANTAHRLKGKIKVIYGLEGYFRNDDAADDGTLSEGRKKRKRNKHITLLVKNQDGMKNLYKLITTSHLEHFDGRPIIYKSLLKKHRDGLLVGSACESGEVFSAIVKGAQQDELHKIASFYDYLEIMPICNNSFMMYEENPKAKNEEELRELNRKVVSLGRELNKPVVATGDVHFLDPEHEVYRQILLTSKGFSDATSENPLYFKSTEEMLEEFSYLGEDTAYDVVIRNPQSIAEMCEVVTPLPADRRLYPPKIEGSADILKNLVENKLSELYGDNPPTLITQRKDYELHDILRLNYDVIYMAAQKLVAYLKEQGSRVGSRGSVGSSFVAHLAGITEVNPLPPHYRCPECKSTEFQAQENHSPLSPPESAHCGADMPDKQCSACGAMYIKEGFNIPFETFMGFDGEKVPDIDLNISGEHQNLAHKFIYDMFGTEYVFRAGTIGTVKEKNAYKFIKDYLEKLGKFATRAEENRLINGCLGVKQTTGQHPGGLIIIPGDNEVTDFCPAHHPADDNTKGTITLHYDYKYIEDYLIKLDILGHDDPTMLRMLESMTGVNADDIKLDDAETMSIFSSPKVLGLPEDDKIIGETGSIGIPEFGTPFTRQMLCDTKPQSFDMLTRLSGYSHGTDVWLGNAKELILSKRATVEETISSRDDIMLFFIEKGMSDREAFSISESVRKGRGIQSDKIEALQQIGVPAWYIESCNKIKYLFPKAHAVAYVMMAFRIAWFKVHKPLEFYSAHFYRRRKSFDAEIMTRGVDIVRNKIRELQSIADQKTGKDEVLLSTLEACYEFYMRGFEFEPLDLYKSDSDKFLIVGENKLRPPFVTVSGLGDSAAVSLVANRENREFISIDEIAALCPGVNKTNLDKLKALGAMGDLPDSRQMSLF